MLPGFRFVWALDFEFGSPPGGLPDPVCLVARELRSGQTIRLWQNELRSVREAPFNTGPDSLFVAYLASAELGCLRVLGWEQPENVLDLFVEFRVKTNGASTPSGASLLGALTYYGLPAMDVTKKDAMRELALRGGPWADGERHALLEYCEEDVLALARLLPCMLTTLDVPRALLRGRYMRAVACMEHVGVPIDVEALAVVRAGWPRIKEDLIAEVDATFGAFDGTRFKANKWERYLIERNIPWPRLPSGSLALDDDTFRSMAQSYPEIWPMRELRVALGQLRLEDLAVGADGRNRVMLSPFRAKTSRNQPSNAKGIFGSSSWQRRFIRPPRDHAVAYIDWSQQEFGIGGALSGDDHMLDAYRSGDPYLEFAKQAGAVPADGSKKTHAAVREQFKGAALAVQYGMAAESLATKVGVTVARSRELLELHHRAYPRFWRWSEAATNFAMLKGRLHAAFGWSIQVGQEVNIRSLGNFPMQANGAEMLRLACCFATEQGISVCAPVHDALLIEAPIESIEDAVAATQQAMSDASALVLDGFRLRSEATIVRYPDRFSDERGKQMWDTVWRLLERHGMGLA